MNHHASLNKFFRLVWSTVHQVWVAVAENARGRSKQGGRRGAAVTAAALMLSAATQVVAQRAPPPAATQLPTGGQVVAGQATLQQNGATLSVQQASQRAAVDWATFNVGAQAQVNFVQPNAAAVTLNRVRDSNPSQILGRMTANGQVFLSNPQGVYFAPGASVDVGGLVATTHNIGLDDFMAGTTRFERAGATGSVINEGSLRAALGGYIALLAPEVRNQGVIVAHAGTAALASGEAITLNFGSGSSLAGIQVSPSLIQSLVDNRSAVLAPGGLIVLSAQAADLVHRGVVRSSGTLTASSLSAQGGRIVLEGDTITLANGSRTEATGVGAVGTPGGGTVLVGGDWQGRGTLHQASTVTMDAGAVIDASATRQGDGGQVVLWSDIHNPSSVTTAQGLILAQGGAEGGQGGRVETSGHQLKVDGIRVRTAAAQGPTGMWLLDPKNGSYPPNKATGGPVGRRVCPVILSLM